MAARSSQVANWLRGLGVRRGDRVLLMLGNVVPLWEVMLAAIKLGAVIIPASTLLQPADLADRISRGRRPARGGRGRAGAEVRGCPRRLDAGRRGRPGGRRQRRRLAPLRGRAATRPRTSRRTGSRRAADPLLLYFTSGTTSQPKLVGHTHASYPVGPPVHDVLDRHRARRRAPEHLLPRLGQARLVQPVRPVERAGHDPHPQPVQVQRRRPAGGARRLRGDHVLRAADGLADAHPGRPRPPRTSARCASAWRRASRSTRR